MTDQEQRQLENYVITVPLSQVEDVDMLAFMGSLIQDHDHLREKLMTEPDRRKRGEKFDCLRAHVKFRPLALGDYEAAEIARSCGVQPIYEEQEKLAQSRIWMPPSFVHEVRG